MSDQAEDKRIRHSRLFKMGHIASCHIHYYDLTIAARKAAKVARDNGEMAALLHDLFSHVKVAAIFGGIGLSLLTCMSELECDRWLGVKMCFIAQCY
jgi:hypothetical protein